MERNENIKLEDDHPQLSSSDHEDEDPRLIKPEDDPRKQFTSQHQLMASMSTRNIAKSLIPKVSVLKKALKSADYYVKFERMLEEFNSIIYYNSLLELLTWFIGLLCFFSYTSEMAWIWMHFLHVPRGIYGLFLVYTKTPKTYDLIESISDFNERQLEERWGFEEMAKHIRDNFKKHLINMFSEHRVWFVAYAIISWLAAGLDVIGLLIQLIRFGTSGDEYSDLFMLAAVIIFLITVISYATWVFTFAFRVEPKYRRAAFKAGMGMANSLQTKIAESMKRYKGQMVPNNQAPKRPNGSKGKGTPFHEQGSH